MDLISQLGELALASRLKRLSDRLLRDVSRVYSERSVDFEARMFPVMFYLWIEGPANITTIAKGLNLTHPAVTQVAQALTRVGLVSSRRVESDDRQRELVLTEKGIQLVEQLKPIWKEVSEATRQVIEETGGELLKTIQRLESALDEKSMYARVTARLNQKQTSQITIVPCNSRFKKQFTELNLAEFQRLSPTDDEDQKITANTHGAIVKRGGMVFLALLEKRVIGTVAIVPLTKSGVFELQRAAVVNDFHRRDVGHRLTETAIDWAKANGASQVVLFTGPEDHDANRLFSTLGFEKVASGEFSSETARYADALVLDFLKVRRQ